VPVIVNATAYYWTLPSGVVITSNTNSVTLNFSASEISGNLTVNGNNECGDGFKSNRMITVNSFVSDPIITLTGNELKANAKNGVQWYYNNSVIPIATGATYTPIKSGDYYVVISENGCISNPSNIIFKGLKIIIYPNPTDGIINIEGLTSDREVDVLVYSVDGKLLKTLKITSDNPTIGLTGFARGTYLIDINDNYWVHYGKVVKIE